MLAGPSQPATSAARFYRAFYTWSRRTSPIARPCHIDIRNKEPTQQACRRSVPSRRLSTTTFRKSAVAGTQGAREDEQGTNTSQAVRGSNTTNTNILPSLSTHVRHLMRRVPHPVVVITASASAAATPTHERGANEELFRGMTVSSFNTVTLEPVPLVSFNVRIPSSTHTAISDSAFFLAHLLAATPTGAQVAHAFARGAPPQEAFRALSATDGVRIMTGAATYGAPLLADGVMKVLKCRPLPGKQIVVGDHMVLVAEVLGILGTPSVHDKSGGAAVGDVDAMEESGLLYGAQGYRQLGPEIDASVREPPQPAVQQTLGLNVRRGDEHT